MQYSAKEEKLRFELDEERKALPGEGKKDDHFVKHIRNVIWNSASLNRSRRLISEGRLKYTHVPGTCGYIEAAP
jgi:hypothetical protein